MKKDELFTYSDAWIFLSLSEIVYNGTFDYEQLIMIADCFEHAIPNYNEVKSAIEKILRYSLMYYKKNELCLSDKGIEIFSKYNKTKGGQFSRVEIMYKKLNSTRNKFVEITDIPEFPFINEDKYLELCRNYSDKFKQILTQKSL